MKKRIIVMLIVLLSAASLGFSDALTFRLGYFIPRADSDFWKTEFDNMTYTRATFSDASYGVGYEIFMVPELSLMLNVDIYSKSRGGFYRDYTGFTLTDGDWALPSAYSGDFTPGHSLSITIIPIQASFKVTPLGRRVMIVPYFGAGAGLYLWDVHMVGDLVDFSTPELFVDSTGNLLTGYPINSVDAHEGLSTAWGWHAFAGLMYPIGNRLTLDVSFKYNSAHGNFTKAFEGFQPFDLSHYQILGGINYWF